MEHKQFDKIRLNTQMNEMVHVITTTPYKSVKESATKALAGMQEQFKEKFGEYSAEHIIKEDEIVSEASTIKTYSIGKEGKLRSYKDKGDVYLNVDDIAKYLLKNLDSPNFIMLDTERAQEFADLLVELTVGQ